MADRKPNLIYVFADQLRYCSMGYAGDKNALTPNIDALCTESTDICQAVSGHPVCAPYRASLFTGKYTTSTGMVINEIRMNPEHHTFAQVLNENGYETAYIGKWHMYAAELGNHYDPVNSFIPKGPDRLGLTIILRHIISGMNMRSGPHIIIWIRRKKYIMTSTSRMLRRIWR